MSRRSEFDMPAGKDVLEKNVYLDVRCGNEMPSNSSLKHESIGQSHQTNLKSSHCSSVSHSVSAKYVKLLLKAQLELECKKSDAENLVMEAKMEYLEADSDLQKAEADQIRIEAMVAFHLKSNNSGVVLDLEAGAQHKAFDIKVEAGKRKIDAKRKLELIKNNAEFDIEEAELLFQLKIDKINKKMSSIVGSLVSMDHVNNKSELQSVMNDDISTTYEVNLQSLVRDADKCQSMDAFKENVEIAYDKVMENIDDGLIVFNDVQEQDDGKVKFVDDVQVMKVEKHLTFVDIVQDKFYDKVIVFNDVQEQVDGKVNVYNDGKDNVCDNEDVHEFISIEDDQRRTIGNENNSFMIVQSYVNYKLLQKDDTEECNIKEMVEAESENVLKMDKAEEISLFVKPVLRLKNRLLLNKHFDSNQQTFDDQLQQNVNLHSGWDLDEKSVSFEDKIVKVKTDDEAKIMKQQLQSEELGIQRLTGLFWMSGKDESLKFENRESKILKKKLSKHKGRKVVISVFDRGKLMMPVKTRPKLLLIGLWRCFIGWKMFRRPAEVKISRAGV